MLHSIYLPTGPARREIINRVTRMLEGIDASIPWVVEIREHKPTRTLSQNATLWMLYGQILRKGNLEGFDKDDVHEFMLGSWSGWETVELFGRKRIRPLKRSATLNKQDFSDYLAFIERYVAEKGIILEMPGDPDA